ncbi:MAG: 50S ribosomal protein L30 [Thermoanaerobaculia bacterium]|nr:50S ribosomal protein L30 [Thermoanaerobaculia bacterium]
MAKKKKQTIRIEQVRSGHGRSPAQREVLRSLGLRKIRHVVEREDTPAVRGMVNKIPHLVRVLEESS